MAHFKVDTYEIRRNKLIMVVAINGDKIINCIKATKIFSLQLKLKLSLIFILLKDTE